MFNKVIHLLQSLGQDSPKVVQESVKKIAENNFLYDITNGRPAGYSREKVMDGHKIIGDFVSRGIQIQKRKMEGQ